MTEREKVIEGLGKVWDAFNHMEHELYADYVYDALALLKAQEPVEPERAHSGGGSTWWNVCGSCKTAINPNDKFCHECGRAVKWDG